MASARHSRLADVDIPPDFMVQPFSVLALAMRYARDWLYRLWDANKVTSWIRCLVRGKFKMRVWWCTGVPAGDLVLLPILRCSNQQLQHAAIDTDYIAE